MTSLVGFGLPGGWELWIILAIFLLLFGHRIPGMARSMGSGIVEFKKGLKEGVGGKGDDDAAGGSGGSKTSKGDDDAAGDPDGSKTSQDSIETPAQDSSSTPG